MSEQKKTVPPAPAGSKRDRIDESSEESFPASDPPAWEPLRSGAPCPPEVKDPSQPRRP